MATAGWQAGERWLVVYALAVSPDSSTVFATGFATGASFYDYETVGYDAATGAAKW